MIIDGGPIVIQADIEGLERYLDRLSAACRGAAPLMGNIAGIMHSEVEDNFESQGRPKWTGYKYPMEGSRQLLKKDGKLVGSITPHHDATSAGVGTNVPYAPIHQFGGKTRAHTIRARRKKALAFNGRFAKSVNHPGSDIPARPFLMLTPAGQEEISQAVQEYFAKLSG